MIRGCIHISKIFSSLRLQALELQRGLFQMPETSGEVPAMFMDADRAAANDMATAAGAAQEELVFDGDAIVLD